MSDESHTSREPDLWNDPGDTNSGDRESSAGNASGSTPSAVDTTGRSGASSELWNDALLADQDADDLLRPKSTESLLRLREQVEAAAEELVRLRQENARLRRRLEELENYVPSDPSDKTVLVLDEDPESTRRKVEHFIAAIDRYLARHQTQS